MTFVAPLPNQTYHPRVYAAFGSTIDDDPGTWVWTNITQYVRPGLGPVALSGGRPALTGTADPSQITLILDNTDGRFTAQSPLLRNGSLNPYWPHVVKNTPLKVAVTWDGAVAEYELLTAFVNGWPLQPNAGLIKVSVPITATGRLRRMRKTNKLIRSALYRAITIDNNITYDGYWSMEDADGSSRFVSVPQAMPIRDIPMPGVKRAALASNSNVAGSAPLADFSSGIRATATPSRINTGNPSWIVDFVLFVGDTPSGSGVAPFVRVFLPNCSYQVGLDLTNKQWRVDMFSTTGATLDVEVSGWSLSLSPFDGQPHMIRFRQTSNIVSSLDLLVDNVVVLSFAETVTFGGDVKRVGIAGVATSFPLVLGHLLVVNNALPAIDNTDAMNGFSGEGSSIRIQRLCNEEGIPVTIFPSLTSQPRMGPQLIDTVANLLDEVADMDDGLLHDAGTNGNLVYAPRSMRFNASIGMKLDYVRHQIGDGLISTYDDQDLITSNTVSRVGGSSATVTSTATSELYAVQDTVSCETDAQLGNIAGWRTHLGTYDAYRLPTVDINVRTTPELAEAATTVDLPFRLSPVNIPSPYPPGSLDQFAEAFATTIDSVTWTTTYSCVPYGPWQVGVYGTSRYDSSSSTLLGSTGLADTSLTVTTANPGEAWTTNPAAFPLNVKVGASEIMRVTNIAPVVSDTFARSVSNGWGTADTGQAWSTVGGVASDYSVVSVGSDGKHLCSTVAVTRSTIIPVAASNMDVFVTFTLSATPSGAPAEAALTCRWLDNSNFYVAVVTVNTAGATTILISKRVGGTDTNLTVDTPTGLVFSTSKTFALRVQAFGTLVRARVWDTAGSEPNAWQVAVTDGSLTAAGSAGCRSIVLTGSTMTNPTFFYDSFTVSYPQTFTVVRGVGGVQMAHAAGEPVHIQPQAIYAL